MREILFRGKSIHDKNYWIYGGIIRQTDFYGEKVDRWFIVNGTETYDYDIGEPFEVDPSTVGQYTGLPDKNGKMIFEGDICRYRETVGKETLLDESGSVLLYDGSWTLLNRFGYIAVGQCSRDVLEVIGNIHDNPELLEKKGV